MSKPRKQPLGTRNVVGLRVAQLRKDKQMKQKELLAALQSRGMDIGETALSRLEGQQREVYDHELPVLADALGVEIKDLYN